MNLIKLYNKRYERDIQLGYATIKQKTLFRTKTRYALFVESIDPDGKHVYTRKMYGFLMAYTIIKELELRAIIEIHRGKIHGKGGEIWFKAENKAVNAVADIMKLVKFKREDPAAAEIMSQELQISAWGSSFNEFSREPDE